MAMLPSPAEDMSETPAIFAINTQYFPFDGQGGATTEPKESELWESGNTYVIESIFVRPGSSNIVTVYNGKDQVIWETKMGTVSQPQDILDGTPILCDGLFSISISNLAAMPSVAFRIVT